MISKNQTFYIFYLLFSFIFLSVLVTTSCGGAGASNMIQEGNTVDVPSLSCAVNNDCDGDGLYTTCDEDDGNAENINIKEGCDEDGDGFVDTDCHAYADKDGDGFVTDEERDVNCDVCPDTYDPEQKDSNQDGIGDACDFTPDVNESVLPPADTAEFSGVISAIITEHSTSVKKGGVFSIEFSLDNDSNYDEIFIDVVMMGQTISSTEKSFIKKTGVETSLLFCSPLYKTCIDLDEQKIESAAGYASDYGLTFSVPSDTAVGSYDVVLRVFYYDDNGQAVYVDRVAGISYVNVTTGLVLDGKKIK